MSKTIRNQFNKKLKFIYFYQANYRAVINKMNKREVCRFEIDLESNITNIINEIKNNKYKLGKYRKFTIYEPKERVIQSLPYKDRVVHQWYVEEFIKPFYLPRFINDTYACIPERGTHKAALKAQEYLRAMKRTNSNYYILKCDIKKYFYSIDKKILFSILSKSINDKKLLEFTKIMIFDSDDLVGIPIGNYTSQYFANIYLNELDHYVKDELKIKYYIRYMDDFILLLDSKEDAKKMYYLISDYLNANLKLQLNAKSRYYPNKFGVNFCGYLIYENYLLVRKRSIIKIKRKINRWNKGIYDETYVYESWNSWKAHVSHANSYNLVNKVKKICNEEVLHIIREEL